MFNSLISGEPVSPASEFRPDRPRTVCITGHREKSILPFSGDPQFRELTFTAARLMLCQYINMAIDRGFTDFISGLATGADLWAAQYILKKKKTVPSVNLIGVMPYLRHAERFPAYWLEVLEEVEHGADMLYTVSTDPDIIYAKKGEGSSLYRDRNYFMVDKSSAVIAFLNSGSFASGTAQTVNYAYRNGKQICRFSMENVYEVIERAGTDPKQVAREISFLPNVFDNIE